MFRRHGWTPVPRRRCCPLNVLGGPGLGLTVWFTQSGYSAPGDPALRQSRTTTSTEARTLTQDLRLQEFDGDDDWA